MSPALRSGIFSQVLPPMFGGGKSDRDFINGRTGAVVWIDTTFYFYLYVYAAYKYIIDLESQLQVDLRKIPSPSDYIGGRKRRMEGEREPSQTGTVLQAVLAIP